MSQADLLRLIVSVLETLDIPNMLVGSHASSFYGEARSTHDVDLVIDLDPRKVSRLVASFDAKRYYLSETALLEGRMANLIDTQTGDKVDCFLLGQDPYDRLAFSRRRSTTIMGIQLDLASPEDTVLSKLRWSKLVGGSNQQLKDAREIIRHQSDLLDLSYLQSHAATLGVDSLLQEITGD